MQTIQNEKVTSVPTAGLGDSYETVLKLKVSEALKTSLIVKNVDSTNSITFKVSVSNEENCASGTLADLVLSDDSTTEETLAAGLLLPVEIDSSWQWIVVQAKRTSAGAPKVSIYSNSFGGD